jgi:hypothetical protein
LERAQLGQPAPRGRLLARLCLLGFCGGLLLLLSSRPAEAAERQEPGLLDPVRTTVKATAREVDSFAGRATGSGSSTVGKATGTARHAVAAPPRPAPGAPRPAPTPTVKRGAPAVPSPVRRAAPPTTITRSTPKPVAGVAKVAEKLGAGSLEGALGPVAGLTGPAVRPLAPVLAPVGSALAPVAGPVAGLMAPVVPGGLLPVPENEAAAGAATRGLAGPVTGAGATGGLRAASPVPAVSQTYPARPAADGASSPATRSIRSWPALTGAVSLPGFPTSAELPAGGPDPLSSSSGAGFALAALAAALLLPGLRGRGRARPDRSGILSRCYLPLVSPA